MLKVYNRLLSHYGPQGWWPIHNHKGSNPTKTGSSKGYHPKDYSFPRNKKEQFEICMGAILTQNTSWPNVEKAIINLHKIKCTTPKAIIDVDDKTLKEAIRPAGYFNQKSAYLKAFADFFIKNKNPTREELLKVKGVGPETADSILLYAFNRPEFVVDAYTKRIFSYHNCFNIDDSYDTIKSFFESSLPRDQKIFQEFHALIVEHAKNHFKKQPYEDPIIGKI